MPATGHRAWRAWGQGQCRARRFADCGWAICKARDVAPPGNRAPAYSPSSEASLRDAEKKLARDRSYTPCKLH